MANTMFEQFGMAVHVFLAQPLHHFIRMRNVEMEPVYFIDQVD